MINKETRDVLKSLTGITDSFILENQTTITDEFKQLICSVDLQKLNENFNEPIGIAKMGNFLQAVDLIPNCEISISSQDDNYINIKNDKSHINFLKSDLKTMESVDFNIIEKTKKADSISEFKISKDVLDTIRKGVSVFDTFDTLFIENKNNKLTLSLGVGSSFNAAYNEFSIEIPEHKSSTEFMIKLPIQGFLKIPSVEYNLEIKYNKEKNSYRIYMYNTLIEIVMSTIK